MSHPIVFIAGVPGVGKSSYGRWLAQRKGFTYVDLEHGELDSHGFRQAWDEFVTPPYSDRFVAELRALKAPVCLDWGFPLKSLPIVQRLAKAGLDLWWLEADEIVAKKYFIRRNTVLRIVFDPQMRQIESARSQIMPLFQGRVITVISDDGVHLQNEDIYARMFGTDPA